MASALTWRSDLAGSVGNPPVIRAICLDIDDTLIDFTAASRSALFAMIGRDDMWAAWQRITDEHVARVVAGELDAKTMRRERTKAFLTDLGVLLDDETVAVLEDRRHALMGGNWRLFHDAEPCLSWLRAAGLKLAAVTNASGAHQHTKLRTLGIADYFDTVLIAGELGMSKPDPKMFRTACDRLDVPPEQTVHVGDKLDLDAVGARDAGLHGVWLNRAATPAHRAPTGVHLINSLAKLPELLVCEYVTPAVTVPAQRS
ncbi:MAG: HAD family hydrolase [Kibdelosporangium sp.]